MVGNAEDGAEQHLPSKGSRWHYCSSIVPSSYITTRRPFFVPVRTTLPCWPGAVGVGAGAACGLAFGWNCDIGRCAEGSTNTGCTLPRGGPIASPSPGFPCRGRHAVVSSGFPSSSVTGLNTPLATVPSQAQSSRYT